MPRLQKDSAEPLYKQMENLLKKEIQNYRVGQKFYTDRALCKKYKVSQPVIRTALATLVKEGFIHRVPTKGTFIKELNPRVESTKSLNLAIFCPFSPRLAHMSAVKILDWEFRQQEHNVTIRDNGYREDTSFNHVADMISEAVNEFDGIVWINAYAEVYPDIPRIIRENAEKLIFLNPLILDEKVTCILRDDRAAILSLTTHLVKSGYRRIGYIGGPETRLYARSRYAGYEEALKIHNLKVDERYKQPFTGGATYDIGHETICRMLDQNSGKLPQALICATDYIATGAIAALKENGLKVPEDVAVTGFDNTPAGGWQMSPKLTTVDQAYSEMGTLAASLFLNQLKGKVKSGSKHYVPCPIRIRESCGTNRENIKQKELVAVDK